MSSNSNQQGIVKVKGERTWWRDANLSERHRRWGLQLPATDLDFLLLEYHKCEPVALIEYKSEMAPEQFPSGASYRALTALGDRAGLPVFVVRYSMTFKWWKVIALNEIAKKIVPERTEINELMFVAFLHNLRGLETPRNLSQLIEFSI